MKAFMCRNVHYVELRPDAVFEHVHHMAVGNEITCLFLCLRARFSTIFMCIHLAIWARTVIVCFYRFMASPVVAW